MRRPNPLHIKLRASTAKDRPLKAVKYNVYAALDDKKTRHLTSGIAQQNGIYEFHTSVPSFVEEILVTTNFIGLPDSIIIPIKGTRAEYDYGSRNQSVSKSGNKTGASVQSAALSDFRTLGTWDHNGVPEYLEAESDDINERLLALVNASLPESDPVPSAHPEYLADGNEMDIRLTEDAEVWVTFVHEGAGWKNALGFYTYDLANPPSILKTSKTSPLFSPMSLTLAAGVDC